MPIYAAGARIHSVFGMAPILDGLGLILVIISYHGRISIGINSCKQIVPDPDIMAECFADSLAELEQAIEQAGPGRLDVGVHNETFSPPERADPLKSFRAASAALDQAIESLEVEKDREKDREKYHKNRPD